MTAENPMDQILGMIKLGVKLKPVPEDGEQAPLPQTPSDEHLKLLQQSLNRIQQATRESSPESDSDPDDFFE